LNSHALTTAPAQQPSAWRAEHIRFRPSESLAAFTSGRSDAGAPVVLFVHGMGHWTQAAWDRLAAELAATHRIIAFDLPGFGASSKPDAAYTLPYFGAALQRVVAHFELDRFAIVGHSLGGLIAADYAAREPARVRLLGLIDPAGFLRTPKLALRVMASRPVAYFLSRLRPSRGFVRRTLHQSVYAPASVPPEMYERVYTLFQDPSVTRAFARVYAGAMQELLHMRELHVRLSRWTGPTVIVWGREDRFVPIRGLKLAHGVFPRAETLVLDHCGHCPNIEMPEAVAAQLIASGL